MMRKILVFSDSHNNNEYMNKALEMNRDADMLVHLGDGACDLSRSFPEHYEKPLCRKGITLGPKSHLSS